MDLFYDIGSTILPRFHASTVFDVGANIGQSAKTYRAHFPDAEIYCFEPVRRTFAELKNNLQEMKRVQCFRCALGSSAQKGLMVLKGSSNLFRLRSGSGSPQDDSDAPTEAVDVLTLDGFCADNNIQHIDFLKIDTEGHDLEVLKGASAMLAGHEIDLVQVEAGMNPGNHRHASMESLKTFLESLGYVLFGIYEQIHRGVSSPHLHRSNLLFISLPMTLLKNAKTHI